MSNINHNHKSSNPTPNARKGMKRVITGYRLVAMRADQVDEIARLEGRGDNPNVRDVRERCPWCFLKGGIEGEHSCRWRTKNNKGVVPDGGPMRQVPIYQWVTDD